MEFHLSTGPALTVALALAAGVVSVSIARHLRLPGIVILLGVGVLLGPDGLGILAPQDLGHAMHILVEFAVAVILFEGGLNLDWRRLSAEGATIRALVFVGAVVTAAGGMIAARLILGWDYRLAILFGTLVIVTGPTVITPLLRRIKVNRKVETVLEAEGVFIDAVGAILAVVALEITLSPTSTSLAFGFISVPSRLVFGALAGVIGGFVIVLLLRFRGVVPEGLENVFTLALALALYQTSGTIMEETGITAVIFAGLVVGNSRIRVKQELKEFKEQLTILLIGMLFVLLAADVRVADVVGLGWKGLAVVLALMFVVRPLNVFICTMRAGMTWREKAFISWLAPRGIVAAAIASLFHDRLESAGVSGGNELRALVFLVIAVTVVFQGSTGGFVARLLGVRRPSGMGYAILGAHALGRTLARILSDSGQDVVLMDANAEEIREAEAEGFRVVFGNALEERELRIADVESRKAVIGVLTNEAVSLLFVKTVKDVYKVGRAYVGIQRRHGSIDPDMITDAGATILFGEETDLDLWSVRLRQERARPQVWTLHAPPTSGEDGSAVRVSREVNNLLLPLATRHGDTVEPVDDRSRPEPGDDVYWLVLEEREAEWRPWLEARGWKRVKDKAVGYASTEDA